MFRACSCSETFRYGLPGLNVFELKQRPCRHCPNCLRAKRKDYAGRLTFEVRDAVWSSMLTLTYAPPEGGGAREDLAEERVIVSHLQDAVKRMRYHWGPLRYFAVNEAGSLHGRRHWHVMVFGQEERPDFSAYPTASGGRIYLPFWNEGHANLLEDIGLERCGYIAKYVNKPAADGTKLGTRLMSNRPILGDGGLREWGHKFVTHFAWPTDFTYHPVGWFIDFHRPVVAPYAFTGRSRLRGLQYGAEAFSELGRAPSLAGAYDLVVADLVRLANEETRKLAELELKTNPELYAGILLAGLNEADRRLEVARRKPALETEWQLDRLSDLRSLWRSMV